MTPQLIPLLLSPILLAISLYAIAVGRRGCSSIYKYCRWIGLISVVLFVAAAIAFVDLVTQVWVKVPGSISVPIYVGCGSAFILCSLVSLALLVVAKKR